VARDSPASGDGAEAPRDIWQAFRKGLPLPCRETTPQRNNSSHLPLRSIAKVAELKWRKSGLRHSHISYRVAQRRNVAIRRLRLDI
jgi:hypothetical protein